jgi:hypothetical protein
MRQNIEKKNLRVLVLGQRLQIWVVKKMAQKEE